MTTKEFLKKAAEIASKYFDVTTVRISNTISLTDAYDDNFAVVVYYTFRGNDDSIHASVSKKYEPECFFLEYLLLKLKQEVKKEHKRLFPPETKTTDLNIEE